MYVAFMAHCIDNNLNIALFDVRYKFSIYILGLDRNVTNLVKFIRDISLELFKSTNLDSLAEENSLLGINQGHPCPHISLDHK